MEPDGLWIVVTLDRPLHEETEYKYYERIAQYQRLRHLMRGLIKQMSHVSLIIYVQIENMCFRIVTKIRVLVLKKIVEPLPMVFILAKEVTKRGWMDIIVKFVHGWKRIINKKCNITGKEATSCQTITHFTQIQEATLTS